MVSSFYGNKEEQIREREKESGYLTYATLADLVGDMVLCNEMASRQFNTLEIESGTDTVYFDENWDEISYDKYDELNQEGKETHEEPLDIYQYYIINSSGANILKNYTNETVFYDTELDIYVWGVAHCGTSWEYVFTNIPIQKEEQE